MDSRTIRTKGREDSTIFVVHSFPFVCCGLVILQNDLTIQLQLKGILVCIDLVSFSIRDLGVLPHINADLSSESFPNRRNWSFSRIETIAQV